MKRILVSSIIILAGCAVNTGVVPIGQDTFMVSRQAATGFTGLGDLKGEAFREANQYCLNQRKSVQVLHTSESSPPYILGNFPRAEVQFRCLDAYDSELKRPKLTKDTDIVLETRDGGASNEGAQQTTTRVSKPSAPQSDVDRVSITRPSAKKNAYAVVVGIESYRDNLPKADFAANDAKLMGEYLVKVLGYPEENVVVRLNANATRNDVEKYVESWLPNHVEKDGSVFIYFSGHGAPNPKTGESYLVPYDGDPTFIDKTGYSLSRLYQHLADLPAKEVVVVLDSCFSGAGGRSVIAQGMRPIVTELKSPLLAKGKTIVLSASTGQQVSSTYGAKSHGLLTYFFLKGLQGEGDTNKDGFIELKELFDYLSPQVARVARRDFNNEQTPQLLGNSELLTRGVRLVE
jgi:hypothetical protein